MEEEPLDKKDSKSKKPAVVDAKKDPKKKPAGLKKEEDDEAPKIQPKVKITADMIDEKSMEEFLKGVRGIYSRTPKLLLIFVTLEDAAQLGVDPEEVSARFLEEKLNSYLETKILWENGWEIKDWNDRIENEYYPEEAVVLFENLALLPVELGYETIAINPSSADQTVKPKLKKVHCLYEDIKNFARVASQYGDIYVLDDPNNFGKRERLSNVYIRPQTFVFGRRISQRLQFAVSFFSNLQGNTVLLLGGELTESKLLFIQACHSFFSTVILLGDLGLQVAHWASTFAPNVNHKPTARSEIMRNLFKVFREKKDALLLPEDVDYLVLPPKREETASPDPKKGPAQSGAAGTAPNKKDEKSTNSASATQIAQSDAADANLVGLFKKEYLAAEDVQAVEGSLKSGLYRGFDIDKVEEYEGAQRADLADRKRKEEAQRLEMERIRKEEEAKEKDQKKKPAAGSGAGKLADKKTIVSQNTLDQSKLGELTGAFPPFHQADDVQYATGEEVWPVQAGEATRERVLESVLAANNVLWIGRTSFQSKWTDPDKKLAKTLKYRRTQVDADEAAMNAEAREKHIGLRIGLVGDGLLRMIDSFDLKDPPVPKTRRVMLDNGDGDEEGQPEEDEEEEEEEEDDDDFDDDDMSSGELRRLRKRQNVDQITAVYSDDEAFFLQLMSGQYLEGKNG